MILKVADYNPTGGRDASRVPGESKLLSPGTKN